MGSPLGPVMAGIFMVELEESNELQPSWNTFLPGSDM